MNRLTQRNETGQAYFPYFFKEETCDGDGCSEKCNSCDFNNKITETIAKYEDAEEQGLLMWLPCKIGDDIYFIPSKVNYDLNILGKHEEHNRVYHQKVARIVFNVHGWYLECNLDLEYGNDHILIDKFYKETWFTNKAEAELALQKMKCTLTE